MKTLKEWAIGALSTLSMTLMASHARAQAPGPVQARNMVLVHGAWADGSSWSEVIQRLQAAGLHVTAVQNPLTSVEDSGAETRRVLALQDGPTVLVAHSWGGTVISETGTDPKVSALVYVAARAPDANEDFVALSGKFPTMPVRAGVQTHDGFTTISEDAYLKYFAHRAGALNPTVLTASWIFGTSSVGSLSFTFSALTCRPLGTDVSAVATMAFWDTAALPGLKPVSAHRLRGAYPHLLLQHWETDHSGSHPRHTSTNPFLQTACLPG
jgi:pimeloyl-ACP methyl ester carboxylesterase